MQCYRSYSFAARFKYRCGLGLKKIYHFWMATRYACVFSVL